ncbi:rhoGAP domain containing protein [Musa troglodytarum]|uniref:RhoGAP domain containing protein n=1 Tax=Musa troglodytarum TaxID=320322 RepID=A0A9E7G600_9LILI|nr:rhoGAP domain containing protein [Musa troglodytarum]
MAWFRELPTGVLDSLSSEQVMQCQTEEECGRLARLLPPTEAALLDWAINLMADVVQEEEQNKMNARNVATVFAPNMTQMADPLTALMYAVQVMNFLRMLILRTLKERRESAVEDAAVSGADPSDEDGHQSPQMHLAACSEEATERAHVAEEAVSDSLPRIATEEEEEEAARSSHDDAAFFSENAAGSSTGHEVHTKTGRSSSQNHRKGRKAKRESTDRASLPAEKLKGSSIVSRINSKIEGVEAWR